VPHIDLLGASPYQLAVCCTFAETCPTLRLPNFQVAAINGNARAEGDYSANLNRGLSLYVSTAKRFHSTPFGRREIVLNSAVTVSKSRWFSEIATQGARPQLSSN
jgi:hypothetical protein